MTPAKMNVRFLDLRVLDAHERGELTAVFDTMLLHGRIVLGPEVQRLEEQVAARCGRRYAVGVSSGTDALMLALKSLDIGPGDEVITTPLSWLATANAVAVVGATPIFADIGDDLNIDPASIEPLVNSRTKAILPVHYTGKVCRMPELTSIARRHDLHVVEDAAQAFDSEQDGRKAGSFGVLGCFSMNPMKIFAACGEAGMIVTDRQDLYDRLVSLRYHGTMQRETCVELAWNGRMDTLQAGVLSARLPRLDAIIEARARIADRYRRGLGTVVDCPVEGASARDVHYTFTIQAERRDELKAYLEERGVETKIQHPLLVPDQPVYAARPAAACPNARRLVSRILCIPAHEKLPDEQVDFVIGCVREFYAVQGTR